MALTPEDVVNKRFQPTKFREGYDQDEVDDFLDEVVVELRRLGQENEELRQRLSAAESAPTEAAPVAAAPASAPQPASVPEPTPAPVAAAPEPTPAPAAAPAVDPDEDTVGTSNLLQLARRLHEEHVREGVEKRDALIAEGHATADRLVSEAEARQRQIVTEAEEQQRTMVAEAEAQQRQRVAVLEQERTQLQTKIDELRTFERDYRLQLKSYIQGQLNELDSAGGEQPSGFVPASAQGFGSN